jgi:hypothetical protein
MLDRRQFLTRRTFLRDTAAGMGMAALATMLPQSGRAQQPGAVQPHLPVKA